jgi:hypothetical protein
MGFQQQQQQSKNLGNMSIRFFSLFSYVAWTHGNTASKTWKDGVPPQHFAGGAEESHDEVWIVHVSPEIRGKRLQNARRTFLRARTGSLRMLSSAAPIAREEETAAGRPAAALGVGALCPVRAVGPVPERRYVIAKKSAKLGQNAFDPYSPPHVQTCVAILKFTVK